MYELGDIVAMKKLHACQSNKPKKQQSNEWEIIRMGADIKIRCLACKRIVMLSRREFEHKMKEVIKKKEER